MLNWRGMGCLNEGESMRKLKFDIIFWDGYDKDTIEHISCEEGMVRRVY